MIVHQRLRRWVGTFVFFSVGLIALCGNARANECDAVLIPTVNDFEQNTQTNLNTLSIIQNNSQENKSTQDKFALTVPIYGIPVSFGYQNNKSTEFRSSTLSYCNQHYSKEEAISHILSEVSDVKARLLADCMQSRSGFVVYFNRDSITSDSATLWVRRFITGSSRLSQIHLLVNGGTIKGKNDITVNTNANGDVPFKLNRAHNQKVTVEANMDLGQPITVIIPAVLPPIKLPEVQIRVRGNLQNTQLEQTFPHQFHFQISKGVRFSSSNVSLQIDEIVDGKICATRTITSANLGDMMNSNRQWRLDEMKVGCQMDATPIATSVECFVDPLYFAECH